MPHKNTIHGKSSLHCITPEYKAWKAMRARCNNPDNPYYKNYGARGIKICEEWNDFENFIRDIGLRPSIKHSLDRIDNNKNYSPSNCAWRTRKEQCRNRRSNKTITMNNTEMTLAEIAEKYNLKYSTFLERIRRGWDINNAIKPVKRRITNDK